MNTLRNRGRRAGLTGHEIVQAFARPGHLMAIDDPREQARASVGKRVRTKLQALECGTGAATSVTSRVTVAPAAFVFEPGPDRLSIEQAACSQAEELAVPEAALATDTHPSSRRVLRWEPRDKERCPKRLIRDVDYPSGQAN